MNDVRCPLSESAAISRDRIAVMSAEGILRYGDLDRCVRTTAKLLERAGCRTGDRVAILLPLSWQYLVFVMALFRVGAVVCFLDPRWPARRLNPLLTRVGCRKVIAPSPGPAGLEATVLPAGELVGFVAPEPDKEATPPRLGLEQPATIFFAQGRGRKARAVLHPFGSHYYSARGSNANLRVGSDDRWLLSVPIHHVEGLAIFLRCVLSGATVVLPAPRETLEHAIAEHEVTHLSVTAKRLAQFLQHDRAKKPTRLREILLVGSAPSASLLKEAEARGLTVHGSYALTEMASQVTAIEPATPAGEKLTSGRALKYRELRIAEDGEVWVRGATLFSGYVEGDRLVRPVDKEGWFATGDTGRLDQNGYLTITGRTRASSRRRGEQPEG